MVVAACLTQGAYVQRSDKKKRTEGGESAMAPPWWENVRFKYHKNVHDFCSSSFASIYEFDRSRARDRGDVSLEKAPRFVVSIRGTKGLTDVAVDMVLSSQTLEGRSRLRKAFEEVHRLVMEEEGNDERNVWLTGHSFGASIAAFVGMRLVQREGIHLVTFLFSPPYLRLDPVTITHQRVRLVIEHAQNLMGKLLKDFMSEAHEFDLQATLNEWSPRFFLNPSDYISSGYIRYFESRDEHFKGMSSRNLFRITTADGRTEDFDRPFWLADNCPTYLLPCGKVTVNWTPVEVEGGGGRAFPSHIAGEKVRRMLQAHKLSQWWQPNQNLVHMEYLAS